VPHRPRARAFFILLVLGWLLSLWLAIDLTARYVSPESATLKQERDRLSGQHEEDREKISELQDKLTLADRSDQISRSANEALQVDLSERDEQIAQLRADVAFYERLVDAASKRQGLSVHSLNISRRDDGAWRYELTLTQNLKQAKVSEGSMKMSVEGVLDGHLQTLEWPDLKQNPDETPAKFSFKYFQQLTGNVRLPKGFTPHRVRVQLKTGEGNREETFPWQDTQSKGDQ